MKKLKLILPVIAAMALSGCNVFLPSLSNPSSVENNSQTSEVTSEELESPSTSGTSEVTSEDTSSTSHTSQGTSEITISSEETSTESQVEEGSRTILIYMCGADLESGYNPEYGTYSDSYLASSDLDEIKSVVGQPENINIVIEAGGAKRWHSSYSSLISTSKLNRFHLRNNKYISDGKITRASMGLSSTFQSFLEWGLTNYPAEKTGVILWNHGGGMRGVCYDELSNDDSLTNDEVLKAVKNAFTKTNTTKLEWIGYDACLMQLQDVAEFNSPYFNYMVASQESETGYGWDYDTWVDDLYAGKDTETILTAICDGFIEDNGGVNATGDYYEGEYYAADQTLSYLDLNYMDEYKTAWENMASVLKTKITSTNKSTFNRNIIGKTKYFACEDYDYFCEFDVYHFLTLLEKNSTFNPGASYIKDCKTALNNLVRHSVAQKEAAHDAYGLSFYYASGSGSSQTSFSTSTYSNFTNWSYLSKTYGGRLTSSYSY